MRFKNLIKLLPIAILVANYQVNAMNDGKHEQYNDIFVNVKNLANHMRPINYANEHIQNMNNIYNNFLTEIGKTQNDKVNFSNNEISNLLRGYSEYLLPKIAYYTKQFVNLHKNCSDTVNASQICSSLNKTLARISKEAQSANNITYKEFFDKYINDENIFLLLIKYFNTASDNEISNETEYEKLASEIIHKQQDTNLLTGLLYRIYEGNFVLLSNHLSNAKSLMDVNNNGVVLFEGLANDLANANNDESARIVLTLYINLINTILSNKDIQDNCSIF